VKLWCNQCLWGQNGPCVRCTPKTRDRWLALPGEQAWRECLDCGWPLRPHELRWCPQCLEMRKYGRLVSPIRPHLRDRWKERRYYRKHRDEVLAKRRKRRNIKPKKITCKICRRGFVVSDPMRIRRREYCDECRERKKRDATNEYRRKNISRIRKHQREHKREWGLYHKDVIRKRGQQRYQSRGKYPVGYEGVWEFTKALRGLEREVADG